MRLRLEYEDYPAFATMMFQGQRYRAMTVKVHGKPFSVWVRLDLVFQGMEDDPAYMKEIDDNLVAAMERMLTNLFYEVCAAVPEGTDLLINVDKKE